MNAVMFSGGLDSLVILGHVLAYHPTKEPVHLLFIDYMSKGNIKEFPCACKIAKWYGERVVLHHLSLEVPSLEKHSFSSHKESVFNYWVPTDKTRGAEEDDTKRRSWIVPYRNFALMSLALVHCGLEGISDLWIAFNYQPGLLSKDQSPAFLKQYQKCVEAGMERSKVVKFHTPLQSLEKWQCVKVGLMLKVPFALSRSCYNATRHACGLCQACIARKRAFSKLGRTDPAPYMSRKQLVRVLGKRGLDEILKAQGNLSENSTIS